MGGGGEFSSLGLKLPVLLRLIPASMKVQPETPNIPLDWHNKLYNAIVTPILEHFPSTMSSTSMAL